MIERERGERERKGGLNLVMMVEFFRWLNRQGVKEI